MIVADLQCVTEDENEFKLKLKLKLKGKPERSAKKRRLAPYVKSRPERIQMVANFIKNLSKKSAAKNHFGSLSKMDFTLSG